jgi:hypothetical protein
VELFLIEIGTSAKPNSQFELDQTKLSTPTTGKGEWGRDHVMVDFPSTLTKYPTAKVSSNYRLVDYPFQTGLMDLGNVLVFSEKRNQGIRKLAIQHISQRQWRKGRPERKLLMSITMSVKLERKHCMKPSE